MIAPSFGRGNRHRNVNWAVVRGLRDIMTSGAIIRVRGHDVRELRNRVTVLENPRERCLFLPHRGGDVFATIAETLWVLSGRNDIEWLSHYLPRAGRFSDDGKTWRAGYGPRLRNWNGIDQLDEVRRLLLDDTATRRAVISLFDPDRDFIESNDIPCNNWLHWLVRDGRLHLNIGVRSNDVIWGFSAANSFEWSVLHEMLSFWLNSTVGDATYFASSFHVYDYHYNKAARIIKGFRGLTCYDFGVQSPPFQTAWNDVGKTLDQFFRAEGALRLEPGRTVAGIPDPLLDGSLRMLGLYNGARAGWDEARICDELHAMPETDYTAAAYEFFARAHPRLLEGVVQPRVAEFFAATAQSGFSLVLKTNIKQR